VFSAELGCAKQGAASAWACSVHDIGSKVGARQRFKSLTQTRPDGNVNKLPKSSSGGQTAAVLEANVGRATTNIPRWSEAAGSPEAAESPRQASVRAQCRPQRPDRTCWCAATTCQGSGSADVHQRSSGSSNKSDNLTEAHDKPTNTTGGDDSSNARGGRLPTTAIPATTFQVRRWPTTTIQRPRLRAKVRAFLSTSTCPTAPA
jgi:hypothetical protein